MDQTLRDLCDAIKAYNARIKAEGLDAPVAHDVLDEARSWSVHGFDAASCKAWLDAGVHRPADAADMRRDGIPPHRTKKWWVESASRRIWRLADSATEAAGLESDELGLPLSAVTVTPHRSNQA